VRDIPKQHKDALAYGRAGRNPAPLDARALRVIAHETSALRCLAQAIGDRASFLAYNVSPRATRGPLEQRRAEIARQQEVAAQFAHRLAGTGYHVSGVYGDTVILDKDEK
jgi:hypothetical protein